jgi:tetratricopeptide (TPR) repeat protein
MCTRPLLAIECLTLAALLVGCGPTKAGLDARAEARQRMNTYSAQFTYDQAEQEFQAGQFDRALRDIDRAIAQAPEVAEFDLLKGRIHLETARLEPAVQSFFAALEKNPQLAEAHYFAGIVFQRWSDDEQAFDHYQQAYEIESDNVQYLLATAEALIALGEFDEAQGLVESRLAFFEHNAALRHLLGQIALLEGDARTAARLYEEARLLDPDNLMLMEELAWAQYSAELYGQCFETVRLLQERLKEQRNDLMHLEARCLAMLGRSAEAYNRFLTLTKLTPDDPSVWMEFGTLAWQLGDNRRMAQCGVRAIDLVPDRYEGYMLKGLYEQHEGRLKEAVNQLRQAADLAPEVILPHLLLGRALEQAGQPRAALAAYDSALRIDPQSSEALMLQERLERRLRLANVE